MQDEEKVYGFTLSLFEYTETIVTLWDTVKEFMALHPEHIAKDNSMNFLSDDGGKEYSALCPDLSARPFLQTRTAYAAPLFVSKQTTATSGPTSRSVTSTSGEDLPTVRPSLLLFCPLFR